jgi:hypothetical protein
VEGIAVFPLDTRLFCFKHSTAFSESLRRNSFVKRLCGASHCDIATA